MDSWQCHWRVLKACAACSQRSPAVARPCPAPTKSQMENGARSSCRGSPSGKLSFSSLRQQVPPPISEVGQVCETETAKTSSDYCCCACCTVHIDRGDLRELLDIPLGSHSIVSGPALPQLRRVAELPFSQDIDTRRTIATAAKLGSLP